MANNPLLRDLARQSRIIYLDPEPSYPNSLIFAAGLLCGVLAMGASVLLWTLV